MDGKFWKGVAVGALVSNTTWIAGLVTWCIYVLNNAPAEWFKPL